MIGPIDQHPNRTGQIQNRAAIPALPECVLEIDDCGTTHRGLHVVPRRMLSVHRGKPHGLPIARVRHVVPSATTKVNPTKKRDVAFRTTGKAHHDDLLMVRSATPGARVEQHFTTGVGNLPRELCVLTLTPARLRTPDQAEDQHPAPHDLAENFTNGSIRPVEQLLGVAAVVREINLITGPRTVKLGRQPTKVDSTVDQGLDLVTGGPRANVRRRVPPLRVAEKPAIDSRVLIFRHGRQSGGISRPCPAHPRERNRACRMN